MRISSVNVIGYLANQRCNIFKVKTVKRLGKPWARIH